MTFRNLHAAIPIVQRVYTPFETGEVSQILDSIGQDFFAYLEDYYFIIFINSAIPLPVICIERDINLVTRFKENTLFKDSFVSIDLSNYNSIRLYCMVTGNSYAEAINYRKNWNKKKTLS